MNQHEPGNRLEDSGGRGEEVVGDDHGSERRRDCNRLLLAGRPEEKEGDAEPGAEQDGGADHMQEFQREVEVHARHVTGSPERP